MTTPEPRAITGQCLCGAVKVSGTLPGAGFEACHCVQCQRWTGGGPYYSIAVDGLEVEGEAHVTTFRASAHGERANCAVCGAPLWWRMQGRPVRTISVGLLDDQTGLRLAGEIFVDTRPDWLPAAAGATQSTEAEKKAELKAFLEANP